jgi:hypothetical protein
VATSSPVARAVAMRRTPGRERESVALFTVVVPPSVWCRSRVQPT